MMDDDESDEMEQDLELDEFFDKIKVFKAKSGENLLIYPFAEADQFSVILKQATENLLS